MTRQLQYFTLALAVIASCFGARTIAAAEQSARPNFVFLFCDDLGYGDLTCYGHPTIRTPHLDRMATEGVRFTQFYTAAAVCSPARASLLTGRYPPRHGTLGIYWHGLDTGMSVDEKTLAELLTAQGYSSTCLGKWHLGHDLEFLPQNRGFESYFGVPYSNDMQIDPEMAFADDAVFREGWSLEKVRELSFDGPIKPKRELVPLMADERVIEYPVDQRELTRRYTEQATEFIAANQQKPFFLYVAYTMPHVPLFASKKFEGNSRGGLYGDTVEEIDWSVGEILETLRSQGLAENTFVFFTSDNGPWLTYRLDGGSQGLLRGGKFTTWEGGMRVPGIAWCPGTITPAISSELATTMDLFTTSLHLAGAAVPNDRVIDGVDLSDHLLAGGKSPRKDFAYYRRDDLQAYRHGKWKIHLKVQPEKGGKPGDTLERPLLFDLERDPAERYDLSEKHPDVIDMLLEHAEAYRKL